MINFKEWLKLREFGVDAGLPWGAQTTASTSMATQPQVNPAATAQPHTALIGVKPETVQKLQRLGPKMQDALNKANKLVQQSGHDMASALEVILNQGVT